MSSFHTLLIGLAGLLLTACLSPGHAEDQPIRPLVKSAFSGIQDPKQEVIKDKAAWDAVWTRHLANAKGAVSQPEVDFSKEMIILVAMGRQNTGGYSIQVSSVRAVGDKLEITVTRTTPPPGSMSIQALTAPVSIVAVPRSSLEPVFIDIKPAPKPKK
jgi:hypothetical protein